MGINNKFTGGNMSSENSEFYEEMLLSYVANKYVNEENEQLEIKLQEIEDVSDVEVDLQKIYKKETKNNISNIKKRLRVYKMGSAVAIFLITFVVITATVPPIRAAVFDFIIRMYDTHADISNYSEGEVGTASNELIDDVYSVKLDKEYMITYLPEGFFATLENKDAAGVTRDYYDKNDNCIMFNQMIYDAGVSIDTENAEISNIDINGIDAIMSIKSNDKTINITWKKDEYFINLTSVGVDKEEIIKVARSIK